MRKDRKVLITKRKKNSEDHLLAKKWFNNFIFSRFEILRKFKVRDVHCKKCQTKLGWLNEFIEDQTQVIAFKTFESKVSKKFIIKLSKK